MNKKILLFPPGYLFLYLILAIILHFLFPIADITSNYRVLGIVLIVFGLVINLWADNLFKNKKTTVKPNKIPTYLIAKGPFSFSRHPMYLGFVLILLGISTILGSVSSFLSPIIMFITLEKYFIPFEEKQMEKYFGEKYQKYTKKVRRWL